MFRSPSTTQLPPALRREQGELTAKATECGRKISELLALPCEVAPM